MSLVIIKYNAGNIRSVLYALERIGLQADVTDNVNEIQSADRVIFPGVGEASTAMNYLKERGLDKVIKNLKQPVLGICLGLQLMCKYSEENNTECMGIFEEEVKLFRPAQGNSNADLLVQKKNQSTVAWPPSAAGEGPDSYLSADRQDRERVRLKVPQIGWNNIYDLKTGLFKNVNDKSYCYFVHGYYAASGKQTIATTDYVLPYSSGLHRDNFYGVQFHPEKSAITGEQIIKNFLSL